MSWKSEPNTPLGHKSEKKSGLNFSLATPNSLKKFLFPNSDDKKSEEPQKKRSYE
jgi:hypothetical protein